MAVLVDAENFPTEFTNVLFDQSFALGDPIIRRCYGDFSKPALKSWQSTIARHALEARHLAPLTNLGKNAADIALAVDAMDLVHARCIEIMCLASSDSDFSPLAIRLRTAGIRIIGFGHREPPSSLRHACDAFHNLATTCPNVTLRDPRPDQAPAPTVPSRLIALIENVLAKRVEGMRLSELGQVLVGQGFKKGSHGSGKFSTYVASHAQFVVVGSGPDMRVRLRHARSEPHLDPLP